MRRQLLFPVVVAAGTAFVLGGCGGSSSPLREALAAARTTLSQGVAADVTLSGATLFGGTPGPIVARALFALPSGVGYEVIDVPKSARRASGPAYLAFLPAQVWVKPLLRSALPRGRFWLSTTFTRSGSPPARFPRLALVLEALNPELLLEEIAWGAVATAPLGERVVQHVPYTEYMVTVDLQRAIAGARGPIAVALRAAMSEELAALRASHGDRGSSRVTIAAWVDGPGRLVQLQASLPGSQLGRELVALSNFGTTFASNTPFAAQSADVASFRPGGAPSAASVFTGGP